MDWYEEQIKNLKRKPNLQDLNNIALEESIKFEEIINLQVPDKSNTGYSNFLNHGKDVYTTNYQLSLYMLMYAEMHFAKMKILCSTFPFKDLNSEYEIVDWGCGQGLASFYIIEELQKNKLIDNLRAVTLIEPSVIALDRAFIHLKYLLADDHIPIIRYYNYLPIYECRNQKIINKYFTQLKPNTKNIIHLFSNILDINGLYLEYIVNIILQTHCKHYICCVGTSNNQNLLTKFCNYFECNDTFYDNPNKYIYVKMLQISKTLFYKSLLYTQQQRTCIIKRFIIDMSYKDHSLNTKSSLQIDSDAQQFNLVNNINIKTQISDKLKTAYKNHLVVSGRIVRQVHGGYIVAIEDCESFLPNSHVGIHPMQDHNALIGQELSFYVHEISQQWDNAVVSHKEFLKEKQTSKRNKLLDTLSNGQIVKGIAKNITQYGVFVDLGGVDGLLHIKDISWEHITRPEELITIGQNLTLKVLSFDRQTQKISLGLKQLIDPWQNISDRLTVGAKFLGKITHLVDYGAFVEFAYGVIGLLHISNMSYRKKLRHPSELFYVDDQIEVIILNLDHEKKRISLGLSILKY